MRLTLNDAWGLLLHSRISPRKKKKKFLLAVLRGPERMVEDQLCGGSTLDQQVPSVLCYLPWSKEEVYGLKPNSGK